MTQKSKLIALRSAMTLLIFVILFLAVFIFALIFREPPVLICSQEPQPCFEYADGEFTYKNFPADYEIDYPFEEYKKGLWIFDEWLGGVIVRECRK